MLGTFVIGLREGMEAALVVGILAAFCKRNGASMRPMWIGIISAVLLSIGVGVALELVSASLPQRAQEGMEAIISAVAIVFVTTMIVWMSSHARGLKKELEAAAGDALKHGTAWAMAGMAFLAIVKEGFETAVFLLATFQAASSATAAVVGAVLGILVAVGIGVGLYHGGIRFNIGKFFQVTGVFLVFVAAGLVVSMLRSLHEAGWVTIGQGRTVDLAWLAPAGSVRAALVTGVLGIPADPRVIEVLGWCLFLVPVLTFVLWPAKRRPKGAAAARLKLALAGGLAVAAVALALLVPSVPAFRPTPTAPVVAAPDAGAGSSSGSAAALGTVALDGASLVVTPAAGGAAVRTDLAGHPAAATTHLGVDAREATWTQDTAAALPATVTLADLVGYYGGRLPVGLDPKVAPGPFDARWAQTSDTSVWTVDGGLLDAHQTTTTVLTLSGGGLGTSRTMTLDAGALGEGHVADWVVDPEHATNVAASVAAADKGARERALWRTYLPALLLVAAVAFGAAGLAGRRKHARLAARAAASAEPAAAAAAPSVATAEAVAAPATTHPAPPSDAPQTTPPRPAESPAHTTATASPTRVPTTSRSTIHAV